MKLKIYIFLETNLVDKKINKNSFKVKLIFFNL